MNTNDIARIANSKQKSDLLNLINLIAQGSVQVSQGCLNNHSVGLADFDGKGNRNEIFVGIQQLNELENHVDDDVLKSNIVFLRKQLQMLYSIEVRIVSIYSDTFSLKNKKKLKIEILKSRIRGDSIPSTITSLIPETESLVNSIKDVQIAIEYRIHYLSDLLHKC
jgi:hypothetical protein